MIDRAQAARMLSHVLASYTTRELDRKWLDKVMQTGAGQRLRALSPGQKHALEFLSYTLSAWLVQNKPDPSAFRSFINDILTDIPTEIVKRMMAEDVPPAQVDAVLLGLDDEALVSIMAAAETPGPAPGKTGPQSQKGATSWMGTLADSLEKQRETLRKRDWREKK